MDEKTKLLALAGLIQMRVMDNGHAMPPTKTVLHILIALRQLKQERDSKLTDSKLTDLLP